MSWLLTTLFAVTAFAGAALLFVVQPMIAKLLLPSYGGSATVWSTSSLFFQVLLLLAYAYAHWTTTRLGPRWQPLTHVFVIAAPVLALPIVLPDTAAPAEGMPPALWLLRTLLVMIGLPFAVIATTGPLMQRWYSWAGQARSGDPYFLFAASNLGSFAGLLAYPLVLEPNMSLAHQRAWWSWGFLGFALCATACAVVACLGRSHEPKLVGDVREAELVRRSRIALWLGLAFVPSSLMLGVTAHITTDIAAIPLLWVVPLAVYLITFVVAFARSTRKVPVAATTSAGAIALVAVLMSAVPAAIPVSWALAVNLLLLALVGFAAHARLAADRPAPETLTRYFLVVALGGALGGLFNGLIAPALFDRVLEYQLVLVAIPLLLFGLRQQPTRLAIDEPMLSRVRSAIVLLAISLAGLILVGGIAVLSSQPALTAAALLGAALLGWFATRRPLALLVVGLVSYGVPALAAESSVVERSRSFYGSYSIRQVGGERTLAHGTTIHGTQFLDRRRRLRPTTYYSHDGPLGQVFGLLDTERFGRVAVVGLGVGTVAAYGRPGQTMTFFEIDPGVVDFARDARLFTYLTDSRAEIETVVGDGRLQVASYAPASFDMVVLDAFSSDSIPVHLLTEEAMEIYASRLTDDGMLLVHITNRVFDLQSVLANAADHLGWSAAIGAGRGISPGSASSVWVALSRDAEALATLMADGNWSGLDDSRRVRWTDDYTSLLSVLR